MKDVINSLLQYAIDSKASDLHLSSNSDAIFRVNGLLLKFQDLPITNTSKQQKTIFSEEEINSMMNEIIPFHNQNNCQQEFNFSYQINKQFRARINIYKHYYGIACAIRIIDNNIKTLSETNAPTILTSISKYQHGLILITGKTGSGKSTTIANIIETINQKEAKHIITLEDPIEFIYKNKTSLIHQREINCHTSNLNTALKETLRQDPNIIVIGELRVAKNIENALNAAETGHLVISTLHSESTIEAIARIIHTAADKDNTSMLLSSTLRAIIGQKLIPDNSQKLIANYEILINTDAIKNLIIERKFPQIKHIIQSSKNQGMQTFEQHLQEIQQQHL